MMTQIVFSDEFKKHDSAGHPENAARLSVMYDALEQSSFYKQLHFIIPEILSEALLYEVHSEEMIQLVKEISEHEDSWIDLDTYVCKSDYETARLAAGGVVSVCRNVNQGDAQNAYALIRPPGHHASEERSMGFCLFNNAALGAHAISNKGKRVLIFDHDVHHGNGTQSIFYERNDVMYQSFHLSPHYPGTGAIDEIGDEDGKGYTINAPVSYGHNDQAISRLLDEIFIPIATQFKPHLIIISAGYDSHHSDQLGGLKLTANIFGEIIKRFQKIQPRIVCTLEGGYNLHWIGKCFMSQIGQMMSQPLQFADSAQGKSDVTAIIDKIKKELRDYWEV